MAGAIIYAKFNENYQVQPRLAVPVYDHNLFAACMPLQSAAEKSLHRRFSEVGAPAVGAPESDAADPLLYIHIYI